MYGLNGMQKNVNPNMNIELAPSFERGASNEKLKKHGGTLIYIRWKDRMNSIKYYSDLIENRKV